MRRIQPTLNHPLPIATGEGGHRFVASLWSLQNSERVGILGYDVTVRMVRSFQV